MKPPKDIRLLLMLGGLVRKRSGGGKRSLVCCHAERRNGNVAEHATPDQRERDSKRRLDTLI